MSGSVDVARRDIVRRALILTVAIETVTVVLRYVFHLESTRDTASTIGVVTLGLRVHHGYVGIVMLLVAWATRRWWPRVWAHLVVWGIALVASDAVHHFLVLWPLEGDPQFHLWY